MPWEYEIADNISGGNLKKWLLIMGQDGWELTTMTKEGTSPGLRGEPEIGRYKLVFKRQLTEGLIKA